MRLLLAVAALALVVGFRPDPQFIVRSVPAPVLVSLSVTSGPVGTTVVLTGRGFGTPQGSGSVVFLTTVATVTAWGDTSITVTVPVGAVTGDVHVNSANGPSNRIAFTVTAPTVTGMSPTSGPVGTPVTITGTNMGASQGGSTITFNGTSASSSSWSPTSISVNVPLGATTGTVIVTIGGTPLSAGVFTVTTGMGPCTPNVADLTTATVQAAITAAATGATVCLPAGSVVWTSGVTISKGIHLQGQGGGRVEGSSATSLAIGTGAKVFTVAANTTITGFTGGESICARFKAVAADFMCGTVTSWVAPTLTLNITSVGGSGTFPAWTFEMPASTIITHNAAAATLFTLTEPTTQSLELSDFRVIGNGVGDMFHLASGGASGKPTLFHDLRCTNVNAGGRCFEISVNRGLGYHIYGDCSFDWFNSGGTPGTLDICIGQGFSFKKQGPTDASWTSLATMGWADPTGQSNFYLEDSYLAGFDQSVFDIDDNSRTVARHLVFDNSEIGSHGQETSDTGVRHYEFYDNLFVFSNLDSIACAGCSYTPNMDTWTFLRGGTGVITGNVMPDITSSGWGNKVEIKLIALGLRRNNASSGIGNLGYACWGNGTNTFSNHGANTNPYPRQVGYGFVNGSGATDANLGYRGDSEPLYAWNNTGGLAAPSVQDYVCSGDCCDGTPASSTTYIVLNRDYFYSTTTAGAKPNWSRFTYPHPLRNLTANGSYSSSFPLTENPISEGGRWTNGLATGLSWSNIRTNGTEAFGTQNGSGGTNDSIGTVGGTFGPTQMGMGRIRNSNPQTPASNNFEEAEILLRFSITANNAHGYECNYGLQNSGGGYAQIVRWNGGFNNFTLLDSRAIANLVTGDVVMCTISGTTITTFVNNVAIFNVMDGTYATGQPGMGFYLQTGSGSPANSDYGFTAFAVQDK